MIATTWREPPLWAPVVGFVLLFALIPVALLLGSAWTSGGGAAGFSSAITNPLNVAAVRNSMVQGGLSAVLAVAIGYPVGISLGRYHRSARSVLLALFVVPFLLPVLIMVQGVQTVFGGSGVLTGVFPGLTALGSGLGGIVVVNLLFNVPIVVLLTAVGVESAPTNLEPTVALLGGGPWRRYRDVWGPGSLVGALAGGLVTFLFSALAFAAPLLLCGASCYTIEARIWALDQELAAPTEAALLGLLLLLLFVVPALLYLLTADRLRRQGQGGRGRERLPSWPRPVGVALGAWTLLVLVAEVSVAAVVIARSFYPLGVAGPTLDAWRALFSPRVTGALGLPAGGALGNSLLFAALAALIALLLGILAGYAARRRRSGSRGLRLVLLVPLIVSPVLLAFALVTVWGPLLGGSSSVWALIVVSQAIIALPFAVPTLLISLSPLSETPREAAEVQGLRPFSAFLEVDLPRIRSALLTACLLAFVIGLGEFTATFFLATPTFTTLPVALYRLDALRLPLPAAAAAALLVIVSASALVAIGLGGRRVEL